MKKDGMMCRCPHHKVPGLLIVLFALLFLLHNGWGTFTPQFVSVSWPVLVGLWGLAKLSGGMCKCRSGGMCGDGRCC